METKKENKHHTTVLCNHGWFSVNTLGGIQLTISNSDLDFSEEFIGSWKMRNQLR